MEVNTKIPAWVALTTEFASLNSRNPAEDHAAYELILSSGWYDFTDRVQGFIAGTYYQRSRHGIE